MFHHFKWNLFLKCKTHFDINQQGTEYLRKDSVTNTTMFRYTHTHINCLRIETNG